MRSCQSMVQTQHPNDTWPCVRSSGRSRFAGVDVERLLSLRQAKPGKGGSSKSQRPFIGLQGVGFRPGNA